MMSDYRKIGEITDKLPQSDPNSFWITSWEQRGRAVRSILGETEPPGTVTPFSWREYLLPGACAMAFRAPPPTDGYIHMTLGLTQPVVKGDRVFPWEIAIRTKDNPKWASDLLYQLLTQWLWKKDDVWFGSHFPLRFFTDRGGELWPSISDDVPGLNVVGNIRGLYLWTDELRLVFKASSGEFGLLSVVGVTEDECRLANSTTPAHLVLLLQHMGIGQMCDPYRHSVLSIPGATDQWRRIESMSHDDAFDELQSMRHLPK
jgi:hypothetical protein